jgi:alkylation response protein AidB-like acyl-CoA dehydrogenase
VNLDFTQDQEALRGTLRDVFEKAASIEVVRASEPTGFDPDLWRTVVDLGLVSMAVPEEIGGGGAGFIELAIAAEALGRTLAPVPLVEAAVAATVLSTLAQHDRIASLSAAVISGELLATLALHPTADGVARLVPGGAVADVVIALHGEDLIAIRLPSRPPVAIANLGSMPIADIDLAAGEVVVLETGPAAIATHLRAVRQWEALTSAALVGLNQRALEIGIEYIKQRKAFGVPIANFQTIQHRLADDATALEGARLLAYQAAWAHDEQLPAADTLSTIAFQFAGESAYKTASESLHFHGGYGYTLEYDIQLYFRRAKAWPLIAGDRRTKYVDLTRRALA